MSGNLSSSFRKQLTVLVSKLRIGKRLHEGRIAKHCSDLSLRGIGLFTESIRHTTAVARSIYQQNGHRRLNAACTRKDRQSCAHIAT